MMKLVLLLWVLLLLGRWRSSLWRHALALALAASVAIVGGIQD
jgi:hypothetical protein